MITFNGVFEVMNKEDKSVPRRDGSGSFDFTEVELQTDDKKPTSLVARLADKEMDVYVGEKYDMRICINSNKGKDGRIWNNFTVLAFKLTGGAKKETSDYEPLYDDEIPF